MIKTYQEKLYNNKKSNKHLIKAIELGCKIYNHCIALHKRYYRRYKKYLPLYTLQHHITKLKKLKKYKHWSNLNSQTIQEITERIDKGYQKFFRKENKRPPTFKKRKKYKSITFKQTGYNYSDGNRVKIGKRKYKFFWSRPIEGKIKTLTIKRDSLGDIYVSFTNEISDPVSIPRYTGKAAGFDFGLKDFLVTSEGERIEAPQPFKKSLNEVQKLSKKLSGKRKGSNNHKKAILTLARKHKKIRNQRKDFHFKLSRKLSVKYDYLFFETLSLNGMVKLWGRKINDLGFSNFLTILKGYCISYSRILYCIDKFYPSSKTCHYCGYINKDLSLRDRTWTCPNCKRILDRDLNAAINIYEAGASACRLDGVRLPLVDASVV